jgi:ABC-type transport system involved in multi-copper enzyme maturation permease subunit
MSPVLLIARKEAGDLLMSPRGLAWLLATTLILSVFALLLVSDTELSLLENAQVVYDMSGTITALGALLAVVIGIDSIAGEGERGSLVPLLLTPLPRSRILIGKLGGQAIAWAAMYVLALPYLWAVGSTGQNLTSGLLSLALFGTPVVFGFGFLALALGAHTQSVRSGLLIGLILLLVSASPLLLGPSLRQSTVGQIFDMLNPLSNALNAYDAILIDSQSVTSQATHLGAVIAWLVLTLAVAARRFQTAIFM